MSDLGHGQGIPRVSVEESVDSREGVLDSAASAAEMATLVEPSFDENILRALCETDVSAVSFVLCLRLCPCVRVSWQRRRISLAWGTCAAVVAAVAK